MRFGKQEQVGGMLQEAKSFVSTFDEIVSTVTEKEITQHREPLKKA